MSTPDPVGPTRVGRRERKKVETRERIFESGVALFAARGYDSTTMEQIGERADVSRATVFNYFARKEDIVHEWFGRLRVEYAKALAEDEQQAVDSTSRLRRGFACSPTSTRTTPQPDVQWSTPGARRRPTARR